MCSKCDFTRCIVETNEDNPRAFFCPLDGRGPDARVGAPCFEAVENQFITWVRAQIKDGKYTLEQLNKELDEWLQGQYHVRVDTEDER